MDFYITGTPGISASIEPDGGGKPVALLTDPDGVLLGFDATGDGQLDREITDPLRGGSDAIDRYTVTLTRAGFESISRTESKPSTGPVTVSFGAVPLGNWRVSVDAFDTEGTKIAAGSDTISVGVGGATASVTLTFLTDEGSGDLSIDITFPLTAGVASVDATLTNEDGTSDTINMTLDTSNEPAMATSSAGDRSAGSYTFLAELKDSAGKVLATVVEAVNVYGNLTSGGTVALGDGQISSAPEAPESASVNQEGNLLKVTWSDSGPIETEYELERSSNSGNSWSDIANLQANTTAYTDNSVSVGTTYRYRVRATNDFGSSPWKETDDRKVNPTIEAKDDTLATDSWNVYAGKTVTIPFANLTTNDVNHLNTEVIRLVSVDAATKGTVALKSSSVEFTADSNASVGDTASFTYTAEITDDGTAYQDSATVSMTVEETPQVIANSDGPYDIRQGGELPLSTGELLSNDSTAEGTVSFHSLDAKGSL